MGITDLLIVLQTEGNTHKCCFPFVVSSMLVHTLSTKAVVLWPEIIDVTHAELNWIVITGTWNRSNKRYECNQKMNKIGEGFGY